VERCEFLAWRSRSTWQVCSVRLRPLRDPEAAFDEEDEAVA